METDKPLSPMAFRFVEEYLKDSTSVGAGKKAAIRAGYSIDTSKVAASRLLADPRVVKLIEQSQKKGLEICGITAARVMQELALVAFAKPGDIIRTDADGEATVNLLDLSKDSASGVEVNVSTITSGDKKSRAVSVKTIKPSDKIAALTTLAKLGNMFPKQEIEVSGKLSLADLISQSFDEDEKAPVSQETIN